MSKHATTLKRTATGGAVITFGEDVMDASIEHLSIWHTGNAATDNGIYWSHDTVGPYHAGPFHNRFVDLEVTGYDGLFFEGSDNTGAIWNEFASVRAVDCVRYGFYFSGASNQNTLVNSSTWAAGSHGFVAEPGAKATGAPQNLTLIGFASEQNGSGSASPVYGIYGAGLIGFVAVNPYLEVNGADANLGAAFTQQSANLYLKDTPGAVVTGGLFNKANYDILLNNARLDLGGATFVEYGVFANRKGKIRAVNSALLDVGVNYVKLPTVAWFTADDTTSKRIGLAETVAGNGVWRPLWGEHRVLDAPTGNPQDVSAAVGDFAVAPTATIGAPTLWQQTSVGTWRPVAWITRNSTTANRPTLRAQDVGVTYLDTTLDADGLLLTWNGTAWIDATGLAR